MTRPRLLTEKCETCIFRPGNPMRLNAGRVREMVNAAVQSGGSIICHSTIEFRDDDEGGSSRPYRDDEAMCRGFYDAAGPRSNFVRVMERLGGFEEVPPPAGQVDSEASPEG